MVADPAHRHDLDMGSERRVRTNAAIARDPGAVAHGDKGKSDVGTIEQTRKSAACGGDAFGKQALGFWAGDANENRQIQEFLSPFVEENNRGAVVIKAFAASKIVDIGDHLA